MFSFEVYINLFEASFMLGGVGIIRHVGSFFLNSVRNNIQHSYVGVKAQPTRTEADNAA